MVPAPLPACGRAIAYGIFESFPLLELWPICFSNGHPGNRIENKTESKLVRRFCLEERRWPQQTTAFTGFSICDCPAALRPSRLLPKLVRVISDLFFGG